MATSAGRTVAPHLQLGAGNLGLLQVLFASDDVRSAPEHLHAARVHVLRDLGLGDFLGLAVEEPVSAVDETEYLRRLAAALADKPVSARQHRKRRVVRGAQRVARGDAWCVVRNLGAWCVSRGVLVVSGQVSVVN